MTMTTNVADDREMLALRTIEIAAQIGQTARGGRFAIDPEFARGVLTDAAAKIRDDRPIPTKFSGKLDGLDKRDSDLVIRTMGPPTGQIMAYPDDDQPHEDMSVFKMSGRHLASLLAAARQEGHDSAFQDEAQTAFVLNIPPEEMEKMVRQFGVSGRGAGILIPDDPPASDPQVKALLEDIVRCRAGGSPYLQDTHLARAKRLLEHWDKPGFQHIFRAIEARMAAANDQGDGQTAYKCGLLLEVAKLTLTPMHSFNPCPDADRSPARLELTPEEASACGFTDSEISAAQAWQAVNEWKVGDLPQEKLPPVKSLRDELTNAALIVMRRHHYNLPGVADMAVGAMLQALEEGVTGALWNRSLGFIAAPSTITERLKCFLRMVRTTQP